MRPPKTNAKIDGLENIHDIRLKSFAYQHKNLVFIRYLYYPATKIDCVHNFTLKSFAYQDLCWGHINLVLIIDTYHLSTKSMNSSENFSLGNVGGG